MLVQVKFDEARHNKLHDMVREAKVRITESMYESVEYMRPIFERSVSDALADPMPQRTGREYLLYVDGQRIRHIASRYGEIPAPLTGTLAHSVEARGHGNELMIIEHAPYAKFLEGPTAVGTVRYRPHLARLCNRHNQFFKQILLRKMHKKIQGK